MFFTFYDRFIDKTFSLIYYPKPILKEYGRVLRYSPIQSSCNTQNTPDKHFGYNSVRL